MCSVSYRQHSCSQYPTDIACKVPMELKPYILPGVSPIATLKTIRSVGLGRLDRKTSAPATSPALTPALLLHKPPSATVSTDWKCHSQRHPSSRPRTRSGPRSHPRLLSPEHRACCRLSIALAATRSFPSITREKSRCMRHEPQERYILVLFIDLKRKCNEKDGVTSVNKWMI